MTDQEVMERVCAVRLAANSWTMPRGEAVAVYLAALAETGDAYLTAQRLAGAVSARLGYFVSRREVRALVDAAFADARPA